MPSTYAWKGDAVAAAKVITCTVGGTVEADDLFNLSIGDKLLSVPAGSTTPATVATAIAAAWNALATALYPEFAEVTALATTGGALTLTGDTAGRDFAVTLVTTEAGGGAADLQTWGQAITTALAGPNHWASAANWGGTAPTSGDSAVLENSDVSILYGLDQITGGAVTLASLRVEDTFVGQIGLPRTNADGVPYPEYRQRYLYIGATVADIRTAGSRFFLDTSTIQTTVTIDSTGTSDEQGVPAILWKGTHASNSLTVNRGDVGVAIFAGEAATIATLNVGYVTSPGNDASVVCGPGVTLTTIVMTGGVLTIESSATTITLYSGVLYVRGAAAVTTLNIYGGTVYWNGSGTITNLNLGSAGVFDCRQEGLPFTVTNCAVSPGYAIYDPGKRATWTNGIDFTRSSQSDGTLDLGKHLTLTPSAI